MIVGLDFTTFSPWVTGLIFAAAAGVVWFAGSRITFMGHSMAERTGLGAAFVGLLLLSAATETSDIGATLGAAAGGNPDLALNNMFGSIMFQTAILAVADVLLCRDRALTFLTPDPVLLLQAVFVIVLLALTLAASLIGPIASLLNIGLWPVMLFLVYLFAVYRANQYQEHKRWELSGASVDMAEDSGDLAAEVEKRYETWSLMKLILLFAGGAIAIFIAGNALALTGEALAEQTGLGSSFIGATLVATSTSLSEFSVVFTAVRLRSFSLAMSEIFGSNSIVMLHLLLGDIFYRDGLIMEAVSGTTWVLVTFGVVVTGIYLVGMIERRERTVLGMGVDSVLVLLAFVIYLFLLYTLR